MRQLGTHVFEPGADGSRLRELMTRAGLDHEAQLLALAGGGRATAELRGLLGSLVRRVLARLNGMWVAQGLELPAPQLEALGGRLLLSLSGLRLEPAAEGREAAALAAQLEARLASGLAAGTSGRFRQVALAGLAEVVVELLGSGEGSALEALHRALLRSGDPRLLAGNLKSQLLAALAELPEGPAREAVTRALAGLESEQLLNVARREFHEGWHLSVPVPDGAGWATAHLFYSEPDHGEGHEEHHEGEDMHRLTVGIEFSRIGPLRADLGVRDDLVALRLRVTDEAVARRLRAEVPELVERLASGGREVRVSVAVAPAPEVEVERLGTNIRWLREHHLMDRSA
jgi:hypothetical protein